MRRYGGLNAGVKTLVALFALAVVGLVLLNWEVATDSVPEAKTTVLQSSHHDPAECLLDPRSESNELRLWHRHQHPPNCSEVKRFYVYRPSGNQNGFGSTLNATASALREAINDNRVFVMDDTWDTVSVQGIVDPSPGGAAKCPNTKATLPWECYFRPVSSCSVADALAVANVSSVDKLMNNRSFHRSGPGWRDRPVVANRGFTTELPRAKEGNHLYDIWQHELKPDHFNDELAISQSLLYLIRLNSPTLSLLKRRLNQPATDKLRQRLWSESGRVLSLPIRGSDKCGEEMFDSGGGKHRRSMYESSCLPWSGYVEAIDSVRRYDLNVTTILVTSEDVRYIQLAKAHASALWRNGSRSVRFVFNDADVSPGSGQLSKHMRGDPRYLKHIERRMGHSSLNIEQELFLSMWTTLVLHMHARYYVLNCGSNWHALIRQLRTSCGASPGTFFCLDHQHPQAPFYVCDMRIRGNKQNEACQNRSQASLDSLHVVEAAAAAERLQAEEGWRHSRW